MCENVHFEIHKLASFYLICLGLRKNRVGPINESRKSLDVETQTERHEEDVNKLVSLVDNATVFSASKATPTNNDDTTTKGDDDINEIVMSFLAFVNDIVVDTISFEKANSPVKKKQVTQVQQVNHTKKDSEENSSACDRTERNEPQSEEHVDSTVEQNYVATEMRDENVDSKVIWTTDCRGEDSKSIKLDIEDTNPEIRNYVRVNSKDDINAGVPGAGLYCPPCENENKKDIEMGIGGSTMPNVLANDDEGNTQTQAESVSESEKGITSLTDVVYSDDFESESDSKSKITSPRKALRHSGYDGLCASSHEDIKYEYYLKDDDKYSRCAVGNLTLSGTSKTKANNDIEDGTDRSLNQRHEGFDLEPINQEYQKPSQKYSKERTTIALKEKKSDFGNSERGTSSIDCRKAVETTQHCNATCGYDPDIENKVNKENAHQESSLSQAIAKPERISRKNFKTIYPGFLNISKHDFKRMILLEVRKTMRGVKCPIPKVLPQGFVEYVIDSSGSPKKLGHGTYGSVVLGKLSSTGELVAIKLAKSNAGDVAQVVCEALMMLRVKHTGSTPQFHGLIALDKSTEYHQVGIVLEYIGNCGNQTTIDFRTFLKDEENRILNGEKPLTSYRKWLHILWTMAEKLKAIHRENVVVNDIKPNNIMMRYDDGTWTPIFIDLGIAGIRSISSGKPPVTDEAEITELSLKHPHIAPEWVTEGTISFPSDVYSLGRIIHLTCKALGSHHLDVMNIADWCQDVKPSNRPTASTLGNMLRSKLLFEDFD